MATITLRGKDQRVTERMPAICACCGEQSSHTRETRFAWFPRWVYLLLLIAGLPFTIAVFATRRFMTVPLPLCQEHARPWLAKQVLTGFLLIHLLILPWGAIALAAKVGMGGNNGPLAALLILGGWFAIGFLLGICLLVVAMGSIRARRITEDRIVLSGVCEEFADAVAGFGGPAPREPKPLAAADREREDRNRYDWEGNVRPRPGRRDSEWCPHCRETVTPGATFCRHCKEWIDRHSALAGR